VPEAEAAPATPQLVLEWQGLHSSVFRYRLEGGLDSGQLYAAATFLDMLARETRATELTRSLMPVGALPPGLDLAGILGGRHG